MSKLEQKIMLKRVYEEPAANRLLLHKHETFTSAFACTKGAVQDHH